MNSSTIKAAAAILYLEKSLKYLSFYPKKNRGNRPRKQGLEAGVACVNREKIRALI